MSNEKDELISAAELSRRIKKSAAYISKQSKKLKDAKCTYGKKYYYRKSAQLLGCDPDNPQDTIQSSRQQEVSKPKNKKLTPKEVTQKALDDSIKAADKEFLGVGDDEDEEQKVQALLDQIKEAIDDPKTTTNRAKLDGLKAKASILTEYYKGLSEKIKNKKLEENMFERDEVMQILSFMVNVVRNALINLPNNYAVNLEGLTQKEIKEHVADDINKILEDFQKVGEQFE